MKHWARNLLENGTATTEEISLYDDLFEAAVSQATVDREKRIVRNVVLLAGESPTRRRTYSSGAISGAVKLYEGVRVYLNHPPEYDPGRMRKVEDLAGKVIEGSVVAGADGKLRGDIQAFKGAAGDTFLDLCESASDTVGMSHNAVGQERPHPDRNGWNEIDAIVLVRSVDLVTFPGTTQGIFESGNPTHEKSETKESEMNEKEVIQKLTLEQLVTINPTLHSQIVESAKTEVREKELKPLQEQAKGLEEQVSKLKSTEVIESVLAKDEFAKLPDALKTKVRETLRGKKDLSEAAVENGIKELKGLMESLGVKFDGSAPADPKPTNVTEGAGGFGGTVETTADGKTSDASLLESMLGVEPEEEAPAK